MSGNVNHEKNNRNSNYNPYQVGSVGAYGRRKPSRIEKVTPLLAEAREACERLGGIAEISNGYVIVNTKLYTVTRKKGK